MRNDWIYDIETYPNVFTCSFEHAWMPLTAVYEISDLRNDSKQLIEFIHWRARERARMVGFNNLGFDYPVLHMLLRMGYSDARTLYNKAQAIFDSQDTDERWTHQVFPSDRVITQIDLFKIHHFDNVARATGLKALEFAMRSKNISDLPFEPGTELAPGQIPTLRQYNQHDVSETKKFYHETLEMIEFREGLVKKYPDKDWLNFNDTKIGKQYFEMELENAGISCYEYDRNGRSPRQTRRSVIDLNQAILPDIEFDHPSLQRVLDWLREQKITETKGVFKDLTAVVDGFEFVFGLGGIHGSVENRIVSTTSDRYIIDLDVASYYPNLAIAQRFFPEHLGVEFCDVYQRLYDQRKGYSKGTTENAMLKLALNGVYGDSNNKFSPFYDPLFTMKITLNGQLLLCLLAEWLLEIPGLKLIQVNTDGLTVDIPNGAPLLMMDEVVDKWQQFTRLELERADYANMFIRDVNNYIAECTDGKVKRKGAYEYKLGWHQNHSALVVPKVAEKVLLEGASIRETVESWPDPMDFMLRVKVPRNSYLSAGNRRVQNTTRYYIAEDGEPLIKWMPPTPKMQREGKNDWRKINVNSGWNVCVCNDLNDATLPVNHDWYIQEIEKLTMGLA